jgi:hypothetical protein
MEKPKLQQLLDPYDSSPTECDGMTRLCHTILCQHNIEHQPMVGTITQQGRTMGPHFWIDLPSGERIDYRLRMWLGSQGIPHGVFNPQDFPAITYTGKPVQVEPLPPVVFKLLSLPFGSKIE